MQVDRHGVKVLRLLEAVFVSGRATHTISCARTNTLWQIADLGFQLAIIIEDALLSHRPRGSRVSALRPSILVLALVWLGTALVLRDKKEQTYN